MERGHLGTFLAPRALPLGQPCLQGSGGLPAAVPEGVLTFYPGEEGDGVQSRQAARLESIFICIYCGQPLAPAGPSNIRDWTSWIHPVPSDPHSIPVPGAGGVGTGLPSRCCPTPGAQSGAGDQGAVRCPRCCPCCSGSFSKGQRHPCPPRPRHRRHQDVPGPGVCPGARPCRHRPLPPFFTNKGAARSRCAASCCRRTGAGGAGCPWGRGGWRQGGLSPVPGGAGTGRPG